MSACLSVSSHVSETTVRISQNVQYMLPVAVARTSSDGNASMLCTSGIADDIMFPYKEGNMLQSKTTHLPGVGTRREVCRFLPYFVSVMNYFPLQTSGASI